MVETVWWIYALNLNFCCLMFVFYSIFITGGGFLLTYRNGKYFSTPAWFKATFMYGKLEEKEKGKSSILSLMQIPKRWFLHFYILASCLVSLFIALTILVRQGQQLPQSVLLYLDLSVGFSRTELVDATTADLSLGLIALHIYRRLYENLFVSSFSSGKMNLSHYIVGHTHYIGTITLLAAFSPGFQRDTVSSKSSYTSLDYWHLLGLIVFICAFIMQHLSLRGLANLRTVSQGEDMANKHLMPKGGLFELVSCPHMMAEILIYFAVWIILHMSHHWIPVLVWVISNQMQVALVTHQWYKEKFLSYPPSRKAIVPFIL